MPSNANYVLLEPLEQDATAVVVESAALAVKEMDEAYEPFGSDEIEEAFKGRDAQRE